MWRVSLILGVLICGLPALAQTSRFSFGAVGGARLSPGAPADTHDESPVYTVGAAFEVSLGDHFAAEVNGLYRRFGYSSVSDVLRSTDPYPAGAGVLVAYILSRTRADSVEFPILGKYYFGRRNRRGRFFAATGYSFQRSWINSASGVEPVGSDTGVAFATAGGNVPGPPIDVGAVFGAGVARKMGPLTVAPEFRYTRWGARFDGACRNQLEILLSLRL